MQWAEVLSEMTTTAVAGATEVEVSGVQYDSRRVVAGDLFLGMRGESADGNRYVERALQAGAAAIAMDSLETFERLKAAGLDIGLAHVSSGRRALSQASAVVFGHPERRLALSAVTGTNGKTTTAWVLEQILASVGRKSVLVGTIETHVAGEVRDSPHTTPESRDLLRMFADGVERGCTEAVIEASSHALDQERVWGMPVDVAIFTNLTQDHLDYHGTMERYFASKAKLFRGVGTKVPRVAIINLDDAYGERLEAFAKGCTETLTFGITGRGGRAPDLRPENMINTPEGSRFHLVTPFGEVEMRTSLVGQVNVLNLLASAGAALARGLTLEEIAAASANLQQVPGRFQIVSRFVTEPTVVVDYAHTDDALQNLTALARKLVQERAGKVITVFGCGGDRDRSKRVKMGRAAGNGSDLVVVTSDNPRSESPQAIIEEVMTGVEETGVAAIAEEDRAGAIAIAIRAARPGDVVLIAGKGHEKVQIFADGAVPFDDVLVAGDVLREIEAR